MELAQRRKLYNACRPLEVLNPGDPRYVALDQLGDPSHRVRGEDWVASLASAFELSDEPVRMLFTGLPGSGKSTELRRLAKYLEDPKRANLLAVTIAAEDVFELSYPIDIPDILFAILDGVERELLAREGADPRQAMSEGVFRRIWNHLSRTDVELGKGELSVPELGKLVIEMKTRPSLRARVRAAVGNHLTRIIEETTEELNAMIGRAKQVGYAGIVVIFDSLERLRGVTTNWGDVLDSAERVFSGGAPYLRLPIHALYTVPTALVSRRRFEQVRFMPMIKLHDREGRVFAAGVDAASEIVTHRVPEAALRELLGDQLERRMRKLIEWSGGYPRELVRLVQSMIAIDRWPLSDSDFARVLNEVGDQYRKLIPASAFPWLAQVAVDRYFTLENDEHRSIADQMLLNNVVLRYLNDKDWFELHPAVREIPGIAHAIHALQRARANV
ncbi:MAG TPA: hypothetical protein VFP84_27545 [Kofleriaceae bacterium]|nr:hypothetical protein [Kofleriaceae bacterium]